LDVRTILVAVAALLALAFPAGAAAKLPPHFVGVSADGPLLGPSVDLNHELNVMVASGVESVRVTWSWAAAQPYAANSDVPPGTSAKYTDVDGVPTDFSAFDQMVLATAQRHLELLPVVLYSPPWDSLDPANLGSPPKTPGPFGDFVAALAQRYGPNGDLWRNHPEVTPLPIRDWQIWNEPNIPFYWPKPFASGYAALLQATYPKLKAVDPGSRLILSGFTNDAWNALLQLWAAGGNPYFDAIAIDPYVRHVHELYKFLSLMQWAMRKSHNAKKPLIVSEYGWVSALHKIPPLKFNVVSSKQQAERVRQALSLFASVRRQYHIESAYWYTWLSSDRGSYYFSYAGLRTVRGSTVVAKPAYSAFRHTALGLEGCKKKVVADRCGG
jgi:hypothetical protein